MGTNSSKTQKDELLIAHQKFTNARQLTFDQIQTTVHIPNEQEYNKWKIQLKKVSSFNKQNILTALNHSFIPQGICGSTSGIVKIVFDNFPYIFQEQLQNRAKIQKHLDQQEMWYLLFTLVSTAYDFSSINKKIGDVRPHNIFVNQTGQIKLGNVLSWPYTSTNCQKTFYDKQKTYISLEEMQMCNKGKIDTIINNQIAESFSIGLTMLHAGLLFNFNPIYNVDKLQIDILILLKKLNEWQQLQFFDQQKNRKITYSSALKGIVKNLCEIHASKRQSSLQIYKLLQPYRNEILNLQQFQLSKQHSKSLSHAQSQPRQKYQYQTPTVSAYYNQTSLPINSKLINNNLPKYQYSSSQKANLGYQLQSNNLKNISNQTFGKRAQNNYDFYLKEQPINIATNQANNYKLFSNYADNTYKGDFLPSATSAVSHPGLGYGNLPQSHSTYTIQKTQYQPQKIIIKEVTSISNSNSAFPSNLKKFQISNFSNANNYNQSIISNLSPSTNFAQTGQKYENSIVNNHYNQNAKEVQKNKYLYTQVSNFQVKNQVSMSSDFLRKIDQQLIKSKNLFPS